MTEVTNELMFKTLQAIQADVAGMRTDLAKNTHQVRNTAQGLVSLGVQVRRIAHDVETLAIAVDGHTARLDRIEPRLESIENRLGLPPYQDA